MANRRDAGNRRERGPGPVQRQRSQATRDKVVLAAIECIAEQGLRRATTAEIAKRAGISRGAVQHQFRNREAILAAVLEQVLAQFREQLVSVSTGTTALEARVRALVEASWNLVCEPTYRAYREILRHYPEPGTEGITPEHVLEQVAAALDVVLVELFADLRLPKRRIDLAGAVIFATLNGVAEQQRFPSYPALVVRSQLSVLRGTILRLLEEAD